MDAFISYRRSGGLEIARNIHTALLDSGYSTFFDIDYIKEGEFPDALNMSITRALNFIIILSPNALDRCANDENDWVRKELSLALKLKKVIIPITVNGFKYPDELPDDIARIRYIQALPYNGVYFREMIEKLIERLRDEHGEPLLLSKKRNISNTFYEGNMSDEERKRIKADYESARIIEEDIFNRLLSGKNNLTLFNPAIYEIDSYMKKYCRPEISRVCGLMNLKGDVDDAMSKYSNYEHQNNFFDIGNMDHDNFEDEMDRILSANSISSFDFVDLTLILRDLVDPEEKLRQIVDRVVPGGVIYVRELDHGMALAYPDDDGSFKHMFDLIRHDDYSGDYEAGRKVYYWMKNADLVDIHFEAKQISTVGLKRSEKRTLFETLFSYIEREYAVMHEKEPTTYTQSALDWLKVNYKSMQSKFASDDFFYSSGFMEFYGFVE